METNPGKEILAFLRGLYRAYPLHQDLEIHPSPPRNPEIFL